MPRWDLVGTLDLVERAADGRLVVVDLKTAARKYSDLQVEASLQLSIYSYATAMNGLADEQDLRLRFDVADENQAAGTQPLLDHPRPGGQRTALDAVTEPHAVRRLLAALGLAAKPPPGRPVPAA